MKRILFILMCVITLGLGAIQANETPAPSGDAPACVTVGNVDAYANDNGLVYFTNYNNYKVTVTWAVYGHRENGSRVEVGSGVVVLGTGSDAKTSRKFTKSSQYTSYSVKISTQKCD